MAFHCRSCCGIPRAQEICIAENDSEGVSLPRCVGGSFAQVSVSYDSVAAGFGFFGTSASAFAFFRAERVKGNKHGCSLRAKQPLCEHLFRDRNDARLVVSDPCRRFECFQSPLSQHVCSPPEAGSPLPTTNLAVARLRDGFLLVPFRRQ